MWMHEHLRLLLALFNRRMSGADRLSFCAYLRLYTKNTSCPYYLSNVSYLSVSIPALFYFISS